MSNEKDREPCAGVIGECACTYHYELWFKSISYDAHKSFYDLTAKLFEGES